MNQWPTKALKGLQQARTTATECSLSFSQLLLRPTSAIHQPVHPHSAFVVAGLLITQRAHTESWTTRHRLLSRLWPTPSQMWRSSRWSSMRPAGWCSRRSRSCAMPGLLLSRRPSSWMLPGQPCFLFCLLCSPYCLLCSAYCVLLGKPCLMFCLLCSAF